MIAKPKPHNVVLHGTSGNLDESEGTHLFIHKKGSVESYNGPVEGELYKLSFNVAGKKETLLRMQYIGYAENHKRYIFTQKK